MFNPFLLIYNMSMFIARPFYVVPQVSGHSIGNEDHVMDDITADSSAHTTAPTDFNMPDATAAMQARLEQLEHQLHQAQQSTSSVARYSKEPKINTPPPFKGNKSLSEFILKCDQVFAICHEPITTMKLDSLLYSTFSKAMPINGSSTYADPDIEETSRRRLKALKQTSSASTYSTECKRYAMYLDWSDETLRQNSFDGLQPDVQNRVLSPERIVVFSHLIDSAIDWDNLLFNDRRANKTTTLGPSALRSSTYTPRTTTSVTTSTFAPPSVTGVLTVNYSSHVAVGSKHASNLKAEVPTPTPELAFAAEAEKVTIRHSHDSWADSLANGPPDSRCSETAHEGE
ncbi:hypothetical protein QFC21_002471 [Naganishia friedmannii]|uniref:Uncharacterized protein n=1 Tax=Naganishia friedmannii TaxID=89922 RepID=A0ACC2VVL8_9TREE|nr:hypothetical protein QFC21_002471 [Naganishia friedmannii]